MQVSTIPTDTLSYEQAFGELETIVTALEGNACSLDESMALFERGQALANHCAALLEHAELRVRQITSLQPDDPLS